MFDGFVANYAVRRVNIGGKLLTNQLKELVSYRQVCTALTVLQPSRRALFLAPIKVMPQSNSGTASKAHVADAKVTHVE